MKIKRILVAILVVAMLATVSLTAFAADPTPTERKVTAYSNATGENKEVGSATFSVEVTDTTITFIKTDKAEDFLGWRVDGAYNVDYNLVSGKLNDKTSETITLRILTTDNVTVTELYEDATGAVTSKSIPVGGFTVKGITQNKKTNIPMVEANYTITHVEEITLKTDPVAVNSAIFMANADGTVTLTKSTKYAAGTIFDKWIFIAGDFEIVDGSITDATIKLRPLKDGESIVTEQTKQGVEPTTEPTVTEPTVTEPTVTEPTVTEPTTVKPPKGPVDSGTKSPGTGGSSLPALAVLALLSTTGAFIAKKKYIA